MLVNRLTLDFLSSFDTLVFIALSLFLVDIAVTQIFVVCFRIEGCSIAISVYHEYLASLYLSGSKTRPSFWICMFSSGAVTFSSFGCMFAN